MEHNTTHSNNGGGEHVVTHAEHEHHENTLKHTVTGDLVTATAAKFKHKKLIFSLLAALIILAALFALAYRFKGLVIAAMVDGRAISRFKVISELERQGGQQTLETLINKKLIANEAKAEKITVSDNEIDEVIKKYEEMYSGDHGSLDDALKAEGITRQELRKEIILQKQVEKLLADKTSVSEEEIQTFITENKVTVGAGKEEEIKNSVRDQLKQEKLESSSKDLFLRLRSKAKIRTFVKYEE